MTFHRYYELLDYWEYRPPVNETVALFVGIKPPEPKVEHVPLKEFELTPE